MIRHLGTRGDHLIRVDRILLLRKLTQVSDELNDLLRAGPGPHDQQAAPGQAFHERAEHMRREVVLIQRRLGLPQRDIARLTKRGRLLPRLTEAADTATDDGERS